MSGSIRLTVAQALVRFLAVQHSERDGVTRKLFAGCFGIFGHGKVLADACGDVQRGLEVIEFAKVVTSWWPDAGRPAQVSYHFPTAI